VENDIAMEDSDTKVFNKLAEEYQHNKNHMIENTLKAGQVVNLAKDSLTHGQFNNWLEDFRVGESLRTCQTFTSHSCRFWFIYLMMKIILKLSMV